MLIRRLLILIPLILGIIAFVFIVMQFAPTDPATAAFNGGNPTAEQLQQFKEENGLLDPLPLQYVHFVTDLVSGNTDRHGNMPSGATDCDQPAAEPEQRHRYQGQPAAR